jgi:hypothetical protein
MRPLADKLYRLSAGLCALLALGLILVALPASSQRPVRGTRGQASIHRVVNFTELARQRQLAPVPPGPRRSIPFLSPRVVEEVPPEAIEAARAQMALAPPPADVLPRPLSPAPAANFEALPDNGLSIPPDTQGAVGPNHLMVALNSEVRVQNRTGATLSTVSLESFWASTGASGLFDPKLAYDPFNNRWIFTAVSDRQSAGSSLVIGASQTSDPTGTWDLFRVDADAGNVDWADYPSLGFNKDWIVVTLNMFTVAANNFSGVVMFVFSKSAMYTQPATAPFTRFGPSQTGTQAPALTYDNTLSTMYLVRVFNPNFNLPPPTGFLRLSTITGPVGSETLDIDGSFVSTPNPWDASPPGGADFASQQGSAQKIQNNDDRMLALVYRGGSLWASHSAFLPAGGAPTRTAAQWWQFMPTTPTATVQQFGRVEGAADTFFAFPTITVNSRGDALMGFGTFSGSQFAGAGYAFRAAGDPVNTMRPVVTYKAGEAAYFKTFGGSDNRWGDYSATQVDPVNDVDFWTIQEYAKTPFVGGPFDGESRWGTWWAKVSPPAVRKRRAQVISQ